MAYGDVPAGGQVRAIFLHENDQEQIARNYLLRDGVEQQQRACISWRVSRWLRQEAEILGVSSISARPWETVLQRAISAVDLGT